MRDADGTCHCFHAAMPPMTKKGNPMIAPVVRYSPGRSATAMAATAPPIAMLIHHGDRSRIANSESCLGFQFMTVSVAFEFAQLPRHAAEHPRGEYRGAEPLAASTGGRNAGGP